MYTLKLFEYGTISDEETVPMRILSSPVVPRLGESIFQYIHEPPTAPPVKKSYEVKLVEHIYDNCTFSYVRVYVIDLTYLY